MQPSTQPTVAIARMGPNCRRASPRREKTMVVEMLHVGVEKSACSRMSPSTASGGAWNLIAVVAAHIAQPVANASQRRSFTGAMRWSAIAPKMSGEMNAEIPPVANASAFTLTVAPKMRTSV